MLGIGGRPDLQTNIFFRRKEIDLRRILLPLSIKASLALLRIILASLMFAIRSTSKLEGQLRNLLSGRLALSSPVISGASGFGFGLCFSSFVSSFCSLVTSSRVKSCKSWDVSSSWSSSSEDSSSCCVVSCFSLISLFPKVPMASKACGQSLNSSFRSSLHWNQNTIRKENKQRTRRVNIYIQAYMKELRWKQDQMISCCLVFHWTSFASSWGSAHKQRLKNQRKEKENMI